LIDEATKENHAEHPSVSLCKIGRDRHNHPINPQPSKIFSPAAE